MSKFIYSIDPEFADYGVDVCLGTFVTPVAIRPSPEPLVAAVAEAADARRQSMLGEAASSDPVVQATRRAFKGCGKDPSRYRPSAERLIRRAIGALEIPSISNVVDVCNLVSLKTGFSAGVYDISWIVGDCMLRVGDAGESYETVGKSEVNIDGLPVFFDEKGPFGSPYMDSLRTAVDGDTDIMLFVLYGLNSPKDDIRTATELAAHLIETWCLPEGA
ncbi:B3/B4 domain-containing protein [Gimibacter soli]|uniref:Phenylalanine--tRNA ligase beta subunit-related protein n=1 Tax=Gimibacter soli TaxID=3024400 RepID=A0AAF0BMR9_9PROT|nr:phenylalanine--tRNA ligase beta subunit-related protein [Gimibacter soli]WCL54886.1 phenylalanine--tRNA ligase beta subunit-related protein [Gimibacter soli]